MTIIGLQSEVRQSECSTLTLSLTITLNLTVGLFHIKRPLLALIWKNPSHTTVRIGLSNPRIIDTLPYMSPCSQH